MVTHNQNWSFSLRRKGFVPPQLDTPIFKTGTWEMIPKTSGSEDELGAGPPPAQLRPTEREFPQGPAPKRPF